MYAWVVLPVLIFFAGVACLIDLTVPPQGEVTDAAFIWRTMMPQLVVVILTEAQACNAVMQAWADIGVSGATILESTGMLRALHNHAPRDDLPLMPSLRSILEGSEVHHRTLFTVVPDDFDLEALIARTEEQIGGFDAPNSGLFFVVPVTRVLGLRRPTTSKSSLEDTHAH